MSNEKKKDGTVYPYFVCGGRHSKRKKNCKTSAILIDVVEKEIEKIYDNYQLPSEVRILLEGQILTIISREKAKYDKEINGLNGEKSKLENKRKKLLETHYNDAIPLDLLKDEQKKIAKELAAIEHEIKMHNTTFDNIADNLKLALDIVENCGEAYRNANDSTKKLMNQAIFNKLYVTNDVEHKFDILFSFKPPFEQMLDPIKEDISKINNAIRSQSSKLRNYIGIAKSHIQEFLECGLSDMDNPSNMATYSNNKILFRHNSSSKELLANDSNFDRNPLRGCNYGLEGVHF